VRSKKHLGTDLVQIGWCQAARAGPIEDYEVAVPRCYLGIRDEHDEIDIAHLSHPPPALETLSVSTQLELPKRRCMRQTRISNKPKEEV